MIFFSVPEEESIQRTFSINVFDHDLLFNSVGQINSMNNSIQKNISKCFSAPRGSPRARQGEARQGGAGQSRAGHGRAGARPDRRMPDPFPFFYKKLFLFKKPTQSINSTRKLLFGAIFFY